MVSPGWRQSKGGGSSSRTSSVEAADLESTE
jgi:hypothetical protein